MIICHELYSRYCWTGIYQYYVMINLMCDVIVIVFVVTCKWTSGNWSDKDHICHLLSYIFLRLSSISDFLSQISTPPPIPHLLTPILHPHLAYPILHPLTHIPQPPSCISLPASPLQPTFPSPIAHLPPPTSVFRLPPATSVFRLPPLTSHLRLQTPTCHFPPLIQYISLLHNVIWEWVINITTLHESNN